jgi:hypothetical protein
MAPSWSNLALKFIGISTYYHKVNTVEIKNTSPHNGKKSTSARLRNATPMVNPCTSERQCSCSTNAQISSSATAHAKKIATAVGAKLPLGFVKLKADVSNCSTSNAEIQSARLKTTGSLPHDIAAPYFGSRALSIKQPTTPAHGSGVYV